jgi:hypothetical protein
MRFLQVIVVPFDLHKGKLTPRGHSPARSPVAGVKYAEAIAYRYDGVGVFGVMVDDVTYDADDMFEIARIGAVPSLEELQAVA